MKKDKSQKQISHFKRRVDERLSIKLDPQELVKKIQNGELKFLERQSRRITLWHLNQNNINTVIVYDKIRKTVVTTYSYEWFLERRNYEVKKCI